MKKFKRVLIANRGEIAVRIIRALRELGIESVAIYSDADSESTHRYLADHAVRLEGRTSDETYLNIEKITKAIEISSADAVHPGYGFLSESYLFVEAVEKAGAKFIGPSAKAMKLMGDKISARKLMTENGVPMVPGCKKDIESAEELEALCNEIGFPVILKAAYGGGGRGMRVVREKAGLAEALAACKREAKAYFGNDEVFCERYLENPRHIEYQILFDEHGNGVQLFERDCSVQRRHQKLLEEAPSFYLNDEQRAKIGEYAKKAAVLSGYANAGTVEFICESPDKAYFMEMNTRIQVEHPVTEMITGVDLISWQIRVAMGEKLAFTQEDMKINGWSIEARINAEDPAMGFMPGPGKIESLRLPNGPFTRMDTHIYPGYDIPKEYDSMIAKLIVWGSNRDEACRRMQRALAELEVNGIPTTAVFHSALMQNEKFLSGDFTTKFLDEEVENLEAKMSFGDHDEMAIIGMGYQNNAERLVSVADGSRQKWQNKTRIEQVER